MDLTRIVSLDNSSFSSPDSSGVTPVPNGELGSISDVKSSSVEVKIWWWSSLALVAVTVLSLSTCRSDEVSRVQSVRSTQAQKAQWAYEMQQKVKLRLRDPESAEFSAVRTYEGSGKPVVCGMVNGSNALGGKIGYQRFVASGPVIALEEQMADGEMSKAWAKFCRD